MVLKGIAQQRVRYRLLGKNGRENAEHSAYSNFRFTVGSTSPPQNSEAYGVQRRGGVVDLNINRFHPEEDAVIYTTEGCVTSWHGRAVKSTNQRNCLLDGCDDWDVSADLPE